MEFATGEDYEAGRVGELLNRVSSAHGKVEKAHVVRDMFDLLAESQYLIHNARFMATVKAKITEMSSEPPEIYAILESSIKRLCAKIKSVYPDDATVGCAHPAAPVAPTVPKPDYRILGMGSYGAVIKPALPNMVDGKLTEFPNNVTKIFFSKDDLASAMNHISLLPEVMGENDGHRANTYTQKYQVKNLPKNIADELKKKNPYTRPTNPIHIVRMPDLGSDVKHIGDIYKQLREIPVGVILAQIQKLLHQTAKLAAKGYGHFDIREPNVMVTPETGALTIIDFDLLDTFEDLRYDYPHGFYSNPPESLFINSVDEMLEEIGRNRGLDVFEFIDDDKLERSYIRHNWRAFENAYAVHGIHDITDYRYKLRRALVETADYLLGTDTYGDAIVLDHYMPYVDNYGLGLTLLEFLSYVYPITVGVPRDSLIESFRTRLSNKGTPYTTEELEAIVTALMATVDVLTRISSLELSKRPSPADAAREMDAIVDTYTRSLPAMANNARAELDRMTVLANSSTRFVNNTRKERRKGRRGLTRRRRTVGA